MNSSPGKSEGRQTSEFQENLELLRNIYFFAGLPLQSLKVVAYICTRETFRTGEYLFQQDDDDGQAFYILSGKAGLEHKDESGDHMIREYEAEEFLGGLVLLSNMRRRFSLKALTDVHCLILTRDKFLMTMEQFPELMPKIIKSVVERINAIEGRFLASSSANCETCRQMTGFSLL
jgi:CRP/FNR family transcriptional regulator, cyclic AMP receptor protein